MFFKKKPGIGEITVPPVRYVSTKGMAWMYLGKIYDAEELALAAREKAMVENGLDPSDATTPEESEHVSQEDFGDKLNSRISKGLEEFQEIITQNEGSFNEIFDLVEKQINLASSLYLDEVNNLPETQLKKFIAFEAGVITCAYEIMRGESIPFEEDTFSAYLYFHAREKYEEVCESVFSFYTLCFGGSPLNQASLGYLSLKNNANEDGTRREGHYAGRYLREALDTELERYQAED